MSFDTPWLLSALALLPVLWWLLRVTPPSPRRQAFPALRLLLGLTPAEESAVRTPLWLLALRLLAAGLVILGLAGPISGAGGALPGSGTLILVIDNSWAAAADWTARMAAAEGVLDRAAQAGRNVAVLATAPLPDGTAPRLSPAMPVVDARARLAAITPEPWPPARAAAAAALGAQHWPQAGVAYLPDGLAAPDDRGFAAALAAAGPVLVLQGAGPPPRLLLPPAVAGESLVARLAQLPAPGPTPPAVILAETGDGRALARAVITLGANAAGGEQAIRLPPEIRNQLARLVLAGPASAGGVVLLDERWRRRPVGLAAADAIGAEAPLIGDLYYLRRALVPYAELREGNLTDLLARPLSVLILADRPIADEAEAASVARFVESGGVLVRFAGPLLAEHPDAFLPVRLIAGDRAMGGAMSWGKPAHLAPFPSASPFAGLSVPGEVTVARQVLAEPTAALASQIWAALSDGTPLVTAAARGAGWVVLFHVTANADWSNLPLSGLFIDMLRRIVRLSAGIAAPLDAAPLAPAETLDGFGVLGPPPAAARPLAAGAFATTPPSPAFPPGFYGPENDRVARNLANGLPPLAQAAAIPGASVADYAALGRTRAFGPPLLAAALALLALDLLLSLVLRGVLRPRWVVLALLLALPPAARAEMPAGDNPALQTRLAYVVTGDDEVDRVSRSGLAGLSDYVNEHTAASLAAPVAVTPGSDDLSFYPLLYWPITTAAAPASGQVAALNDYMSHGGIILIDTRDADAGAEFNPGGAAMLRRLGAELAIPPLAPLTVDHVLARTFFLLRDFPGRYDGATVWVQRDQDRSNDSVSPVIIGANDWAAAWATDADGHHPYAVIPGGDRQRLLAYRFGVNLVMYALTGNYKGDQVHVPAILERLGQ